MNVNVGIDIGSTTVKIVVVRDGEIIHKHYERHFSKVREKAVELVRAARELIGEDTPLRCSITGSAGLGVAKAADIDFVQEVFATRKAVGVHVPQADVVIELGGEDAKIVFLTGQLEERTLVQELESVETLARVDCLNLDKTIRLVGVGSPSRSPDSRSASTMILRAENVVLPAVSIQLLPK